jgi:hypothetical protein
VVISAADTGFTVCMRFFYQWLAVLSGIAMLGCVASGTRSEPAARSEVRGVLFLQREVPAWSKENGCFSCHNNGDGARALFAAAAQGYKLPAPALEETLKWVIMPHRWKDNKGDPGFSDQRLANIQFAASLLAAIDSGKVTNREPLLEAARKVAADQSADGAWPVEPGNAVGSPVTYGTGLATLMSWRILNAARADEFNDAIRKASEALRRTPADSVSSCAVLLLALPPDRESSDSDAARRDKLLKTIQSAQTSDGGWGPYLDSPPETFDTALVLLALAGNRDHPGVAEQIRRGRAFLAAQQRSDGSWPATTRPPGGESYAQQVSTTGWATLALLATREQKPKSL